MIVNSP